MNSKLLTISQASKVIGVSIQTMRRWDYSGQLLSVRKKTTGNRYYKRDDINNYIKHGLKDIFKLAKSWVLSGKGEEPYSDFYCSNSYIFQSRLIRLEGELNKVKRLGKTFSLVSAITGEIGNNSFDHNLGNWPDIQGVLLIYNLERGEIILADRGQGILKTLRKVKPILKNHQDALHVAFTEVISGRAPEHRGNGLKFVKDVISTNKMSLFFQTGDAQLKIYRNDSNIKVKKSTINFHGCLVLIRF